MIAARGCTLLHIRSGDYCCYEQQFDDGRRPSAVRGKCSVHGAVDSAAAAMGAADHAAGVGAAAAVVVAMAMGMASGHGRGCQTRASVLRHRGQVIAE
jgi:hypothetical protein